MKIAQDGLGPRQGSNLSLGIRAELSKVPPTYDRSVSGFCRYCAGNIAHDKEIDTYCTWLLATYPAAAGILRTLLHLFIKIQQRANFGRCWVQAASIFVVAVCYTTRS